MKILVGVRPDDAGEDGLALAAVLARLTDASIVLCHVHPQPFEFPSLTSVDAQWRAFVEQRAQAAVDDAKALLARDWAITNVESDIRAHTSRGRGLLAAQVDTDARIIVIGPAPSGPKGALSLGSIADRLLHNSAAAVALAPEGYRDTAPDHLRRLVVGFRGNDESDLAVATALRLAQPHHLRVELLTLVLRSTRIFGTRIPRETERAIMELLLERERHAQADFIESTNRSDLTGKVVEGDTTDRALARLDWGDDDVFVLASSTEGPLHRVVLGDMTHRILRNSDVPALVLPRRFSLRPSEDDA